MFGNQRNKGATDGRRSTRARKISQRMSVVDDSVRQQAVQMRLDALENDNEQADAPESNDEEFVLDTDDEEIEVSNNKSKKRKASSKRRTKDRKGPLSFQRLLEESTMEGKQTGPGCYLSAAAAPSAHSTARKFCSVCGNLSAYTCARCGSKYCCKKCYSVHMDTRCLKFMA